MYNLDKERLEEALRKKLILRLLDSAQINIERERALSEALRTYFGGKFNHRFQLLLDSISEEATMPLTKSGKLEVITIPSTVWPQTFPNLLKMTVIEP